VSAEPAAGHIERLITEEIRRLIADAINDGGIISAPKSAALICHAYNGSGLSQAEIANKLMMAASSAGVAVEFGSCAAGAST